VTANLREWRHIFQERMVNKAAQHNIRRVMHELFAEFDGLFPACFYDISAPDLV
jgi:thymidylate synthase ThyX